MRKLFGTDGIRAIAGKYPLDRDTITKLGFCAGKVLNEVSHTTSNKVVIGRDTRESGKWIFDALVDGLYAQNFTVVDAGVVPTPLISLLVKKLNCACGIMISASHNPYEYNGIKFFSSVGEKLSDDIEYEIEENIFNIKNFDIVKTGKYENIEDKTYNYYRDFLLSTVDKNFNLNGMKIVVDCSNGSLSEMAPKFFRELGAEVITLGNTPDGKNINKNCGSTSREMLLSTVPKEQAVLGFAFDGDGDRVLFTDEIGNDLDGDYIMAIVSDYLKEKKQLVNNTLVVTIMSNIGLKIAMKDKDINIEETSVGDRYVYERMKETGGIIGGEQSGHIILREFNCTGDGMLTAIQILKIVKEREMPFSSMSKIMKKFPQILLNVKVSERKDVMSIPALKNLYDEITAKLGETGRINVRYSGTEPLLRVMIEGENQSEIENMAKKYVALVEKEFEALV